MTKVLAVAGSARRGGNSDALLDAALEQMRSRGAEVQTIVPRELPITPCRSCHACWETGRCVVQDCMQQLYPPFCEANHLVVASPIYFTSLPGHLKVLIDRFQCLWVRTCRLGQPPVPRRTGMFLCVGAMDRQRYYRSALTIIKTWMSILNVTCAVSRFYPGLDGPRDTESHPEYVADARRAALELLNSSPV